MLFFNNAMYVSSYNLKHDRLPSSLILLDILLNLKDVTSKNIVVSDATEDKKIQ